MKGIGLKDAYMDENGYVFGTIEANSEEWKGTVIGFIAHMDVVRDVPDRDIKARVVEHYDGSEFLATKNYPIV